MIRALYARCQRTGHIDSAAALDRAVDRLYRKKPFASDKERLELLFERHRELTEA